MDFEVNYNYFFYSCDNFNDNNWGCVYRNLQTLVSALIYFKKIPKESQIPDMETLVTYFSKGNINEKDSLIEMWIEPHNVALFLEDNLQLKGKEIVYFQSENAKSRVLYTPLDIYDQPQNSKLEGLDGLNTLVSIIQNHFSNSKLPIIVDNGISSYVLADLQNDFVLIIDPHKTQHGTQFAADNLSEFLQSEPCWMLFIVD
ncbi:hypothetical protein M0811_01895 [Anaeramoeba ignava]|uniref:UFSP1/2/DUB catalytic domain-containing protein n=1 Tax=Anaeramoeba ignava TaxID=1746090 RepID=A0A9Q0R8C9_ANAIG|nr:hypothetical protein M0811_01895 [Anaeramoeba ignava]